MTRHARQHRLFAVLLAALAGLVDATGFLSLGGFFVSFMSGNSTRLGVGLALSLRAAGTAGALIAAFVGGAMMGSLLARAIPRHRGPVVLLMVAVLLAIAAGLGDAGLDWPAVLALAFGMGAENNVFKRDGEVTIGVTYMTGTLVRLGQSLAGALTGGSKTAPLWHAVLWLGLTGGAVAGAWLWPRLHLDTIWLATGLAGVLTAMAIWLRIGEAT